MTNRNRAGAPNAPRTLILKMPPWAGAEAPRGRFQAESSRTADRAAHTPADDTTQVSAVPAPPSSGESR